MNDLPPRRPPALSRRRMSKAQRRAFHANACGENEYPVCNLCPRWILPNQKWVESHFPVPHAWGGKETGIAHKRCNDLYWANVEAPAMGKVRRLRDKVRDIHVSRNPLPGGKDDPRKRRMDRTVVDRITGLPWRLKGCPE